MTQELLYAKRGNEEELDYVVCVAGCRVPFDNTGPDADGNKIELYDIVLEGEGEEVVKRQVLKPAKERMGVMMRVNLPDGFVEATETDFQDYAERIEPLQIERRQAGGSNEGK